MVHLRAIGFYSTKEQEKRKHSGSPPFFKEGPMVFSAEGLKTIGGGKIHALNSSYYRIAAANLCL